MFEDKFKKELEETASDSGAQLFEPIGGGYVRLDLHKAKSDGISEEKIAGIFMESANSGEKTEIEPKLELLKELGKIDKPILLKRGLANTLKELLMRTY